MRNPYLLDLHASGRTPGSASDRAAPSRGSMLDFEQMLSYIPAPFRVWAFPQPQLADGWPS